MCRSGLTGLPRKQLAARPRRFESSHFRQVFFLSVAQLGARLFREQEVASSILARETRYALVAQLEEHQPTKLGCRKFESFRGCQINADKNVPQFKKLQKAEYGAALYRTTERWPSGQRRSPAKREPVKNGHLGPNPSLSAIYASLAQLGERSPYKTDVACSIQAGRTKHGNVAQLARAPACHAGRWRFNPARCRQIAFSWLAKNSKNGAQRVCKNNRHQAHQA